MQVSTSQAVVLSPLQCSWKNANPDKLEKPRGLILPGPEAGWEEWCLRLAWGSEIRMVKLEGSKMPHPSNPATNWWCSRLRSKKSSSAHLPPQPGHGRVSLPVPEEQVQPLFQSCSCSRVFSRRVAGWDLCEKAELEER